MNNNEKLTETLNDLIKINNDRVAGYEKAADKTNTADIDLRAIFLKMANESRDYVKELVIQLFSLAELWQPIPLYQKKCTGFGWM